MIILNIPNSLTMIRIAVIPVIIFTFYFDDTIFAHRLASALFFIAGISDFFDGFLARKYNWQTEFGRMLDPIADKILVGCILLMLVKFEKANEIPCLLILSREFLISGLREFLAEVRVSVPVSQLAKFKTLLQMVALFLILLGSKGSGISFVDILGNFILWIAAVLTIFTGYSYLPACKNYFFSSELKG